MQDYTKLDVTKPLKESIPAMQKSIDSVASNFSGTAFPTENVAVGMTCLRTDLDVLYICTALGTDGTPTWKEVIKTDIGAGSAETDSDGNVIKDTYLNKNTGGTVFGDISFDLASNYIRHPDPGPANALELGTSTVRLGISTGQGGTSVTINNSGDGDDHPILLDPSTGTVTSDLFNGTAVNVSGNVTAGGNVSATGTLTAGGDVISTKGKVSAANISTSGDITATGNITGAKVFNAVYNDYAEFFPRGGETEPGDIIALDTNEKDELYKKATKSSRIVVGVQSSEFAQVIGGTHPPDERDFMEWNLKSFIPVALAGRVHVKVKGAVKKGDYIVPSNEPGIGVAGRKSDKSVGRALTSDSSDGVRLIKILVR